MASVIELKLEISDLNQIRVVLGMELQRVSQQLSGDPNHCQKAKNMDGTMTMIQAQEGHLAICNLVHFSTCLIEWHGIKMELECPQRISRYPANRMTTICIIYCVFWIVIRLSKWWTANKSQSMKWNKKIVVHEKDEKQKTQKMNRLMVIIYSDCGHGTEHSIRFTLFSCGPKTWSLVVIQSVNC